MTKKRSMSCLRKLTDWKIPGPEYVALMDGLQKLGPENKKRVAEIMLQIAALDRLCMK